MSVGVDGTYDVVLQDTEVNPKVELGLILAYSEEGAYLWSENRVPPLPPRTSAGALDWTHKDPITDFVFSQTSWRDGAFKPYYDDHDPQRYAASNGIDLRWDGVAALGSRRSSLRTSGETIKSRIESNLFLANGDWEEGQVVGWSAGSGTTLSVESTSTLVRTGNYAGKLVVAQGTGSGVIMTQTVSNPTVYRSRAITVFAYVNRAAGSNAGVILNITDSAGTTSSSTITSSTYSYVSATRTIDSGATSLTITLSTSATLSTDAHTFYVDDLHLVPAGGVQAVGTALRGSTDPDQAYVALGRCILYWSESVFAWIPGYIDATSTVTAIIEFDDVIYAGFGPAAGSTPHQYVYGTLASWTTAALNATTTHQDNHATFFVKARTGYGEWALWKSGPSTNQGTETNRVAWSTDPSASWFPSTYFVVGSDSRAITGLYAYEDTFIVGKVDGIYGWDGVLNDFATITTEWEHSIDPANASVGQAWHGDLYLTAIRQGLFRYSPSGLQDISTLFMAPRLTDFGGRVTAMTSCARELILGLDQPTTDTTVTKTSRLVRLRVDVETQRWQVHTSQEPTFGLIDALTLHRDTRLWAFGRTYDANLEDYYASCNVWVEPLKIAAPYADITPDIEWQGWLDTCIWHGGMPETDKAFIAVTIWCEDLDSNHTIKVEYGRDGRPSSYATLGTFNQSGRVQTLFFKNVVAPTTEAVGRFIQLRFTFTTNDTVSPKMYAFALHTQLVPTPIRSFTFDCWVGGGTIMRNGVAHELTKSETLAVFDELERQVFPLTMVDDFGLAHGGSGDGGSNVRQVRLRDYERSPEDDLENGQERWRIVVQEVAVTPSTAV